MRPGVMLLAVLAVVVVAPQWCSIAHARPTHGSIEPLAAGVELETTAYFPLDLGRTWTYRDSTGIRYRWVIAGAVSPVDKAGKKHDWLRRREVSELPKDGGPPKLLERWLFEIDPERGIVSIGGVETSSLTGPLVTPGGELELPKKLTAGQWWIEYRIRHDFRGRADVDVAAGSFKDCLVIDGIGEHKLPSGERADVRSFYCRDVGLVAQLVMVQGAWRVGLEMEEATTPATGDRRPLSGPSNLPAGDSSLQSDSTPTKPESATGSGPTRTSPVAGGSPP